MKPSRKLAIVLLVTGCLGQGCASRANEAQPARAPTYPAREAESIYAEPRTIVGVERSEPAPRDVGVERAGSVESPSPTVSLNPGQTGARIVVPSSLRPPVTRPPDRKPPWHQ